MLPDSIPAMARALGEDPCLSQLGQDALRSDIGEAQVVHE